MAQQPSTAIGRASRQSLAGRLSLGALGVGLVLLVSLAWATAVLYLVVRIGSSSPVSLALVDGMHIYVGIASLAFIAGKLARVGLHERVAGVPELLLWQRWISWSLLVLYGGVYGTGFLLLAPWPLAISRALVNAHLLTAVWTVLPSAWHVWHNRARALPYLPGPGRRLFRRFWIAVCMVLLPLAVVLAFARAVSPLAQAGNGNGWTQAPGGINAFVDRLAATPDGTALVAGGEGLYVSRRPGSAWKRVGFPADLILALALPRGPTAAYVGTGSGLYASPRITGPYARLPFPSREVHGISVDPNDANIIWAVSRGGIWRSSDGGDVWVNVSSGLTDPSTAWAINYFDGSVFASDAFAVYRWDGSRWEQSSRQRLVVSLDLSADGRRLFASSMGQGVWSLDGHRWVQTDDGLVANHGGVRSIHVTSVTISGRRGFAATMFDGTATSTDGGRSWTELGGGLPTGSVWRVLNIGGRLIAATDHGLYAYPMPRAPDAGVGWLTFVIGAALMAGLAGVALGALPDRLGRG